MQQEDEDEVECLQVVQGEGTAVQRHDEQHE
jgi:hypothetical protein